MRSRLTRLAVLAACLITGSVGIAATTAGADAAPAPSVPHTRQVVVRPVTAAGAPAPGWTVRHEKGGAACWGASSSAVSDGITACGPSALYLPSCWHSGARGLLCLRDPGERVLVRIRLQGAYPTARAPHVPVPQELVLGDGEHCEIRVGGAWGTVPGHPRWLGFYSCDHGALYGPPRSSGIDRSHPRWQVNEVSARGVIHHRVVRKAVDVGTAR